MSNISRRQFISNQCNLCNPYSKRERPFNWKTSLRIYQKIKPSKIKPSKIKPSMVKELKPFCW